ncbi:MAG: GNAT family N-acetyltransferase, partial [Candidatus Aminicenantales bacterium]
GGVVLDVRDAAAVREAFALIVRNASAARPEARIDGVAVQPMARLEAGLEMILGAKKDATFGTILMAGMGGIAAELFGDRALGFPPLNERLARWMLESLKIYPLLQGYRGRPGLAIPKLLETMIRLSYLAADYPEIAELDINPLLVTREAVVALDARIVLDRAAVGRKAEPFAHLALRPYPEEYVRTIPLPEGGECLLRPIKPEDEPLWMELLGKCSRESIYQRFRGFFSWASHDVAVRYCYVDYDRDLAIVAETKENGRRILMGIGRLVSDPMKTTAEYAVLIGDPWQEKGLGGILTDYCLEIARDWGVREVVAVTNSDNPRMVAVFEKRVFAMRPDPDGSFIEVSKDLE